MLQGLEYNGKVCQDIEYAKVQSVEVQGMTTQMFNLFWTAGCVYASPLCIKKCVGV